jgi:serine/threonine protein phosphatase PrpC
MEDRHVLAHLPGTVVGAIFDGHAGSAVAELGAELMGTMLAMPPAPGLTLRAVHAAAGEVKGGACAVAFRLSGDHLEVANVGDAALAWVTDGGAVLLTESHRLDNPGERDRVVATGAAIAGRYLLNPRTGDGLMPTRTLGDYEFAEVGVLAEPYEWAGTFTSGWLVAASDGLWDVMRPEELPAYLAGSAHEAAEALAEEVLAKRQSGDNLTIIIVHKTAG